MSEPRPRRSPAPEERQADAERSRKLLLSAALDVFSAKGLAGARVQEIADLAGVNKQLINYYFGGKDGLYRELRRTWRDEKAAHADNDLGLADQVAALLRYTLADPRQARLTVWSGLINCGPPEEFPADERFRLAERQETGELAAGLDPEVLRFVLLAAAILPVILPDIARQVIGHDPADPEFETRYAAGIRAIIERLAP